MACGRGSAWPLLEVLLIHPRKGLCRAGVTTAGVLWGTASLCPSQPICTHTSIQPIVAVVQTGQWGLSRGRSSKALALSLVPTTNRKQVGLSWEPQGSRAPRICWGQPTPQEGTVGLDILFTYQEHSLSRYNLRVVYRPWGQSAYTDS